MRTKEFLSKLEHSRIAQAIRAAEASTSGEIRVYIQRGKLNGDPLAAAQENFDNLGMRNTRDRNAALIFIAPRTHKLAVVGDKAIHEKCGGELWQRVASQMQAHFRSQRFTDALVDAIEEIGTVLATHFPKRASDRNELPGNVIEG